MHLRTKILPFRTNAPSEQHTSDQRPFRTKPSQTKILTFRTNASSDQKHFNDQVVTAPFQLCCLDAPHPLFKLAPRLNPFDKNTLTTRWSHRNNAHTKSKGPWFDPRCNHPKSFLERILCQSSSLKKHNFSAVVKRRHSRRYNNIMSIIFRKVVLDKNFKVTITAESWTIRLIYT